jgi:tetratricopeptide (TPR) repeat protein
VTTTLPAGRAARRAAALLVLLLAACAPPPAVRVPEPEPPAPPLVSENAQRQAVARHRKLAQDATRNGDLAAAAAQWQILTLLVPTDAGFRDALATARAGIATGEREQMSVANAALAAGDQERAAQAALRALALDPENADAARLLRDVDKRRMARTQADRANRARLEDQLAIRNAMQNQAAAGEYSQSFDIDQAVELFRAGDTAGGLRELRAFVDAHPGSRPARQRAGQVVADRARELEDKGARAEALDLYDQATAMYGDKAPWAARAANLRKVPGSATAAKPKS